MSARALSQETASAKDLEFARKDKELAADGRRGPNHAPANKLSQREVVKLIAVATSPEYREVVRAHVGASRHIGAIRDWR